MNIEVGKLLTEIVRFTNRHRIDAVFHLHTIDQLRTSSDLQAEYWRRFEKNAGVYSIFERRGDAVRYVGMSERDTGSRLFGWLFKENKVSAALSDEDIVLSVVLADEPYMAPALESYLIAQLAPALNVRGVG